MVTANCCWVIDFERYEGLKGSALLAYYPVLGAFFLSLVCFRGKTALDKRAYVLSGYAIYHYNSNAAAVTPSGPELWNIYKSGYIFNALFEGPPCLQFPFWYFCVTETRISAVTGLHSGFPNPFILNLVSLRIWVKKRTLLVHSYNSRTYYILY